jgi:hypothetical protein
MSLLDNVLSTSADKVVTLGIGDAHRWSHGSGDVWDKPFDIWEYILLAQAVSVVVF